jgi:hypothetical protein
VGLLDGTPGQGTLVVGSNGFDERTWVDHFGYPHSSSIELEERYRRTAYDVLELGMTITDPKIYTKGVDQPAQAVSLAPENGVKTIDGWAGLFEDPLSP